MIKYCLLCLMMLFYRPAICFPAVPNFGDSVRTPEKQEVKGYDLNALPSGTVIAWAGTGTLPDGWVECDGSNSFNIYDLIHGTLPDYRGLFLREMGGNAGALGTLQDSAYKAHSHQVPTSTANLLQSNSKDTRLKTDISDGTNTYSSVYLDRHESLTLNFGSSISGGSTTPTTEKNADGGNLAPQNTAVRWLIKIW